MTLSSLRPLVLLVVCAALGCADRSPPAPSRFEAPPTANAPAGPAQHVARCALLEVHATWWLRVTSPQAAARAARALADFAIQHDGYVQSTASDDAGAGGEVTLRVAPDALGALRSTLARLGGGDGGLREHITRTDVTDAIADLDARLRVARATEARLLTLLDQRGAALADVLAVERALAEERTTIERLESEQRMAQGRVELATVEVRFEGAPTDLRAPLGPQLRDAARDGLGFARSFAVGSVLVVLRAGPVVLMLAAAGALALATLARLARRNARPR